MSPLQYTRRKKINKIMRLHGVKEEAIQELNEYDLNTLKKYRCYKRNEVNPNIWTKKY